MKHGLLTLALLCFGSVAARAQSLPPTSCASVSVSTSTPSEITGNTTDISTSSHTWFVTVFNLDTSADLYCSQDSAVAASGPHLGVPILHQSASGVPFNFFGWYIGPLEKWYCKSTGASATTAMVCRNF